MPFKTASFCSFSMKLSTISNAKLCMRLSVEQIMRQPMSNSATPLMKPLMNRHVKLPMNTNVIPRKLNIQ